MRRTSRSTSSTSCPFEDRANCMRRFEAGEVQSCSDIPAEQIDFMREKFGDQVHIAPYLGTYYLPVKMKKEKLADPRVRHAISMAIDRDFLAKEIWRETMLPGLFDRAARHRQLRRAGLPRLQGHGQLDREDAAKKLLEEAGVAAGLADAGAALQHQREPQEHADGDRRQAEERSASPRRSSKWKAPATSTT